MQILTMQSQLEYLQENTTDQSNVTRLDSKVRDLETRLDFEKTTTRRLEVIARGFGMFWNMPISLHFVAMRWADRDFTDMLSSLTCVALYAAIRPPSTVENSIETIIFADILSPSDNLESSLY